MEALIVDLRDNPGGELRAMVDLASDFLPAGSPVVVVTDGDGDEMVYRAQGPRLYAFPLLVLVNAGTASAAELFAGSMKWHKRAVIAGEVTLGKGSAQALLPGSGGGAIHATAALCALPNGEPVQGVGVQPDVALTGVPRPPPRDLFESVHSAGLRASFS
jgi:carboxyl-terminal processing protease